MKNRLGNVINLDAFFLKEMLLADCGPCNEPILFNCIYFLS